MTPPSRSTDSEVLQYGRTRATSKQFLYWACVTTVVALTAPALTLAIGQPSFLAVTGGVLWGAIAVFLWLGYFRAVPVNTISMEETR